MSPFFNIMDFTFDKLTRKSKFSVACAVMRNPIDGKEWHEVHKNPYQLADVLTTRKIHAGMLSDIYQIPHSLFIFRTDEH